MIDLHSHIIPGVDDGADTLETSLEMLRIAERDGIKTIFATPHYFRGRFEASAAEIEEHIKNLRESAMENNINIQILQGQEVLLDREILNLYRKGIIRTLNDSRYLLIELPFDFVPDFSLNMIYELMLLGVQPILAHPERYLNFINKPSAINDFINEGCLFQLNAGSLLGLFGKDIQRLSETYLKNGIISFISSDAHTTNKRTPELKKSFDILEKMSIDLKYILTNNAEKLINNHKISKSSGKIQDRKSIFDIFKRK